MTNEITGTKHCKNCEHFFNEPLSGQFCMLPQFKGQYTKECEKKQVKRWTR